MNKTLLALAIAALLGTSAVTAAAATADAQDEGGTRNSPQQAHRLDEVEVTALPIKQNADEVIAPISVLVGAALDDAKAATLGETVARLPGVQTTYFGPGVGRPVIRGLDGPRVGVLSNGASSGDVSTVSQDHAVSIEPFLADQIEVLKGPATLLYGSGAIGGVVNVVDGRIPEKLPDRPLSGRAELRGNDGANERSGMARIDIGAGSFALHADGNYRDTDDYDGPDGKIANSFLTTKSGSFGGSWIGARGYLGAAFTHQRSDYGLPGHAHGKILRHAPAGLSQCPHACGQILQQAASLHQFIAVRHPGQTRHAPCLEQIAKSRIGHAQLCQQDRCAHRQMRVQHRQAVRI